MQPLHIASIEQLAQLIGQKEVRHPLVMILKVESLQELPLQFPMDVSLGFYVIGLVRNLSGQVQCGRREYDFHKGTMFFLSPNQLIGHAWEALQGANGWLVLFHQAYLAKQELAREITQYGFFEYVVNEALHLSPQEEDTMEQLLGNIFQEYQASLDRHSRKVIVANLALLMTYADRYYGRQFIMRSEMESNFLTEFDQLLNESFQAQTLTEGIPTVSTFAERLHMSPKYLGDKLRVLSGKTAQEHIHLKLLEKAKTLLQQKTLTISEVAYQLGFSYPQYFHRFFKKKVGITPKAFQQLN